MNRLTLIRLGVFVGTCLLWEALTRTGAIHAIFLPTLSDTLEALARLATPGAQGTLEGQDFYRHLWITLLEVAAAYAIAASAGLVVGLILGFARPLRETVEPIVATIYAVPTIVFYPMLYLSLGLGSPSKVAFGALIGFLPVLIGTLSGVRGVDPLLIRTAYAYGASTIQVWYRVVLPAAAPVIVSGLRLGLNLSLIGVFSGQIIASFEGMGFLIHWAGSTLRTDVLYALVIVTLVLAVAGNQTLLYIESRLSPQSRRGPVIRTGRA